MAEEGARNANKRKVMVAIEESEYSHYALKWVLENLHDSLSVSSLVIFTVQTPANFADIYAASSGSALAVGIMGKRKIEIEKIEDRRKLEVTFSKRRKGLFGKAMNLGVLCDAKIAMLVFSPAGNPYTFATPGCSVESIIDHYVSNIQAVGSAEGEKTKWEGNKEGEKLNQCSCACEGKKEDFWWDLIDIDGCSSVEELQHLRSCLESLRKNVCQTLSSLSSQVTTIQPPLIDDHHAEQPPLIDDDRAEQLTLIDDFVVDDFLLEQLLGLEDESRF